MKTNDREIYIPVKELQPLGEFLKEHGCFHTEQVAIIKDGVLKRYCIACFTADKLPEKDLVCVECGKPPEDGFFYVTDSLKYICEKCHAKTKPESIQFQYQVKKR
jgi:hypothetical protein